MNPACSANAERLIVFTRHPEPGKAKTRLIPLLGAEGAAELHAEMTRHSLRWARQLHAQRDVHLEVHFDGGSAPLMQQQFGSDLVYRPQVSGDLGLRMNAAFEEAFHAAACRVLIVGTDCPGITPEIAGHAFDALTEHDLVLGPASDGGYYAVALRRPAPQLFRNIAWGSDTVLHQTLDIAQRLGLTLELLPTLPDVDRPEDLHLWQARSND